MKHKKILLLMIFTSGLFLRLFLLRKIPSGVTNDEANVAYDTFLLTQAGKDQWGKAWPLEFKGFGDYRLPAYQYLLFPFIKIFGMDPWVIRLPTAILGSLSILLIYFFVCVFFKEFKQKENLALITALVLALNPWHFGMSRWIMESNVGLFFALLAIFFILRNRKKDWLWAGISTVISFYTYYSLRFFLPLFLFFLIFFYKKWPKRRIVSFVFLIFIFCLPIIFSMFKTGGGLARVKQVNLTHDMGLVGQIDEYRNACLKNTLFLKKEPIHQGVKIICTILFNRPVFWTRQFILNYFNHFSFSFLFFEKFERAFQFLPPHSFFYFFNLPFFIIGLSALLLNFPKKWRFLIIWLLIAPLADSLTGSDHYARSFVMVAPVLLFIAYGYWAIIVFLKKRFAKKLIFITTPFLTFYLLFTIQFFFKYFTYFPEKQSKYSHYAYKPLFNYLKTLENSYDNIYISRKSNNERQYIFYLYYNKISADKFFSSQITREEEANGWIIVRRYDKYHFIDEVGQIKKYPPNSLLVVGPKEIKKGKVIEVISFLDGKTAFKIFETNELFYKNN